jgi:uncharacterized membrane protein HdeD (DUF308 family)
MIDGLRTNVARLWWVLLVRGLASICFGIAALAWPGITLASLVLVYGAYCFADGLTALFGGYNMRFWQSLIVGAISIGAGLATFFYPGVTALALLYLIATWAVVRGVFEIMAAIRFRKILEREWMLVLAGLASIAFGILVVLNPGAGALSVLWIMGSYALLFGILLVVASLKVKRLAHA